MKQDLQAPSLALTLTLTHTTVVRIRAGHDSHSAPHRRLRRVRYRARLAHGLRAAAVRFALGRACTLGALRWKISAAKPLFFSNEGASRSPFSRRLRRFSPRRAHADARVGGASFSICRRTPAHPEPHCAFLTDDPWRVRAFVQVCDRLTQSRRAMPHLKREGEVRHLLINYIADTVRQRNDELPKPIARARLYHLTSARRPVDLCAGA